ncbi:hypothetical protein [uncultured Acinetobacter sp.]|uniref:hypothetical protein n=1 Tax=uncultured Acinetobacter sp. TaxID=165433 RepID=UPI003747F911
MATVTAKNLVGSKFIENAQTTQYTASSVKALIDKCTVTNVSGAAATFSINLVTSGSAGTSNLIIKDQSVAAGQVYTCPEVVGHILEAGGLISAISNTASALVLRVSGREVT